MRSGESAFIDQLRRLATDPAARGLNDDAAVVGGLVLTHDMIAEGVHFLSTDPPASVGWKLVTVNLSDLAGKGAEPVAALMGMSLRGDGEWEEKFLGGIAAACETYGIALVGGGEPIPSRSGGSPGDTLWLVGLIGDASAGLEALRDDPEAEGALVEAYRRPVPQLAAGRELAPHATAMMDVSDGLLLDVSRL